MGGSLWSSDAYSSLKDDYSTKSTSTIFTKDSISSDMNPKDVKFRESRDSDVHPESLAIIVGLDETGSMGSIPSYLIKNKLGALIETMIKHGVPDAHVLFAGIGDHTCDISPLQIGQFEAGTDELNKWLTSIFLESGGGSWGKESYLLAWLFAGRHTSIDCFEKRNEKGFLFTIGDEWTQPVVTREEVKRLLGYDPQEDLTAEKLLAEAQRMYNVFHLHICETGSGHDRSVKENWEQLLGERVIMVQDHKDVAEIIASTVAVVRGAELEKIVSDFDSKTASHVTSALVKVSSDVSKRQVDGIVKL